MGRTARVLIPEPLPHQVPILASPARFKVIASGRRFGKTKMAEIALTEGHGGRLADGSSLRRGLLDGAEILWAAPSYPEIVASGVWRDLKASLADYAARVNESERRIELPRAGAVTVKSTENEDSVRGGAYDGVVFDEAASHAPTIWREVIRPSLADRRGWAMFIGTPKGIDNWFRDLYEDAAARPGWARWRRPTGDNPVIAPEEIADLRRDMGPLEFSQEVLAEFVSATAGMFKADWFCRHVMSGADGWLLARPGVEPFRVTLDAFALRFATMDLATSAKTSADYTVVASWGLTAEPTPRLVLLEVTRERIEGGPAKIALIRRHVARWRLDATFIESGGFQTDFVRDAARDGLIVRELHADRDKVARALPATSWLERGRVWWGQGGAERALESELLGFPEGAHDDMADCVAYAVRVATDLAHHPADGTYQEPEPERARGALGITRERLADRGRPLAPRRRRW